MADRQPAENFPFIQNELHPTDIAPRTALSEGVYPGLFENAAFSPTPL